MFTPVAVMEMLAQLHELGYERLRLASGISPTGLNWRYSVAPADQFEANGYLLRDGRYPGAAFGTTRGDDAPFGWDGAEELGGTGLADMFLERFPDVAAAGKGPDPNYKQWFASALAASRPDGAPVMYGEDVDVAATGYIMTGDERVPLPPPLPDSRAGGTPGGIIEP